MISPVAGQVHAEHAGGASSARTASVVASRVNIPANLARHPAVVQNGYSEMSYSRFFDTPVSRETTSAAVFRDVPARSRSATAASASAWSATLSTTPGPMTTVISP